MLLSRILLSALLVLGLAAHEVPAQRPLGNWHGGVIYYVSGNGSATGSGSLCDPVQTVSQALALFNMQGTPQPTTINVLPDYSSTNEVFPLLMPDKGVCLEGYGILPTTITGFGITFSDGIVVLPQADRSLPDSVIQNLRLTNHSVAIRLGSLGGNGPSSVQIRQCELDANGLGILINVGGGEEAYHVIEQNTIHDNVGIGFSGSGVQVVGSGGVSISTSSTLIRCNEVYDNPINIVVDGNGGNCVPRIFSNFVSRGVTNIQVAACTALIVNNAVAFAAPHNNEPTVVGIRANAASLIANNIIWNPFYFDFEGTGWFANGVDLLPLGLPNVSNNDFENGVTYVGSNGNISVVPNFAVIALFLREPPPNLRIGANSPVRGLGDNALVTPGGLDAYYGSFPSLMGTGVSMDFDRASRVTLSPAEATPTVDMGAHEVEQIRLGALTTAAGNLYATSTAPAPMTVTVTGPPGDLVSLVVAHTFPLGAIDQATYFAPFGYLHVDLNPVNSVTLPAVPLDAFGTFTLSFNAPFSSLPEYEFFLQAVNLSNPSCSNRLQFEVNDATPCP